MSRLPIIAVVILTGLTLGGCAQAPLVGDTTTIANTTSPPPLPASPTTTQPSTSEPSPPTSFDTTAAVNLMTDDAFTGILDATTYYPVGSNATLRGIDVRTGESAFQAYLTSQDGRSNDWACPLQAVDDHNVYTAISNYSSQQEPVAIELTVVDKATGDVAWRYSPHTSMMPAHTDCGVVATYDLTPTAHGLLFALGQLDDATGDYDYSSEMLDATTGVVLWQVDHWVSAVAGSNTGVALDNASVSLVDLTSGAVGPPLITTPPMDDYWFSFGYSLAGQTGDASLVTRLDAEVHSTPAGVNLPSKVTVFFIAGGQVASTMQLPQDDLSNCQLSGQTLVCIGNNDPTRAYGISLTDGSTVWQKPIIDDATTDVPPTPVLFDGCLYGISGGKTYALDTANGAILGSGWPQPLAVNEFGMVYDDPATGQTWWAPVA